MDLKYMKRALELAQLGRGYTSPNPVVGAVIVKDGRVIGEGYHERYGQLHAERNALAHCTEDPEGAEIYVTLEPCCHHGKTPPCTEALIEAKIAKVYVGSGDPNPKVAGKGLEQLRAAGIEVVENVMKEECDRINRVFFHFITTGKPFVTFKYAMTADGKIATHTGASKWVSGEEARAHVQKMRLANSAIMVGIGTVLADDPMLNCRIAEGADPVRVICDSKLRIPMFSKIVNTAKDIKTLIVTCANDEEKIKALEEKGCEVLLQDGERVNLKAIIEELGRRRLDSLLIEGGGSVAWSALKDGLVDRVMAFISPKIFGGTDSKTPVGGVGVDTPDDAIQMKMVQIRNISEDILVEYEVQQCSQE